MGGLGYDEMSRIANDAAADCDASFPDQPDRLGSRADPELRERPSEWHPAWHTRESLRGAAACHAVFADHGACGGPGALDFRGVNVSRYTRDFPRGMLLTTKDENLFASLPSVP